MCVTMVKLMLCLSVLALLLALADSRYFCCTQYHEEPVSVKKLKYYIIQEDTGYCNIKAVIFKTIGKPLCANPERKWVKFAMETIPRLPRKQRKA